MGSVIPTTATAVPFCYNEIAKNFDALVDVNNGSATQAHIYPYELVVNKWHDMVNSFAHSHPVCKSIDGAFDILLNAEKMLATIQIRLEFLDMAVGAQKKHDMAPIHNKMKYVDKVLKKYRQASQLFNMQQYLDSQRPSDPVLLQTWEAGKADAEIGEFTTILSNDIEALERRYNHFL